MLDALFGKQKQEETLKRDIAVKKVTHLDLREEVEVGGLSNALRKRHWYDFSGGNAASFDETQFEGDRGAMFRSEESGGVNGFLALTKDREKNTAAIKIVRAEMRDPEIVRSLLMQAMEALRADGISAVTVKLSEDLKAVEHVFEEMKFHKEEHEGDRDVLVAHP